MEFKIKFMYHMCECNFIVITRKHHHIPASLCRWRHPWTFSVRYEGRHLQRKWAFALLAARGVKNFFQIKYNWKREKLHIKLNIHVTVHHIIFFEASFSGGKLCVWIAGIYIKLLYKNLAWLFLVLTWWLLLIQTQCT